MIVVSDSTTLIILSDLDKFGYLKNLFLEVIIPQKVFEEITYKNNITLPSFIKIENINTPLIEDLKLLLDDGESESIALAIQKNLPLIIDEKKGRKIAKNLNLKILGLLGIIYLNIKKGFVSITEAKEFLDLAQSNGYRISQNLINDMFNKLKD